MISFAYAKQQGAKYLLTTEKGDIKAYGNTESVLLFSRQKKAGDMVVSTAQYRKCWPYKY